MTDNVLILGAGFSYDAGIPLLSGFIERMWEYSIKKSANGNKLTTEQTAILDRALEIRAELDGYHGRVVFDDRNIEDILSMLAFNILGGGKSETNKFKAFISAISETIELSCSVKHPGQPKDDRFQIYTEGSEIYRDFWKGIFSWYKKTGSIPTIITFNYDLVLERSLLQLLINTHYSSYDNAAPFAGFKLNYFYQHFPPEHYKIEYTNYGYGGQGTKRGTITRKVESIASNELAEIEILKLHGSLNFPISDKKNATCSLTLPIEDPYILPPVSNKHSNGAGDESWKTALNRLRAAKNIVFVGYSLPKTDMYMQFFLKAALGPNRDLNKICVFDPTLSTESSISEAMRERYRSCFSQQIRPRIDFTPYFDGNIRPNIAGTTNHFVNLLKTAPERILF